MLSLVNYTFLVRSKLSRVCPAGRHFTKLEPNVGLEATTARLCFKLEFICKPDTENRCQLDVEMSFDATYQTTSIGQPIYYLHWIRFYLSSDLRWSINTMPHNLSTEGTKLSPVQSMDGENQFYHAESLKASG